MLNLAQAIEHGKRVGVRYYVVTEGGTIMGGTITRAQAVAMKKGFELEDSKRPWRKVKYHIKKVA